MKLAVRTNNVNATHTGWFDLYSNDLELLQTIAGEGNWDMIEDLRDEEPENGPVQVKARWRLVVHESTPLD